MNTGIKIALSLAGFSETDIHTIENALPAAERMLAAVDEFDPLIRKYYPDISAVTPAVRIILAYAKKES